MGHPYSWNRGIDWWYRSDKWSRMNSLILSTIILLIFTALSAGSYYHGDAVGMFNILTAWRFFVSYPTASVAI